jgi:hypothetical protein
VLNHIADEGEIAKVRQRVGKLTARFPLYGWKLDHRKNQRQTEQPSISGDRVVQV